MAVSAGGGSSQVSGFRCFQMRMCQVSIPGCGVTSLVAVVFKVSTDFRFLGWCGFRGASTPLFVVSGFPQLVLARPIHNVMQWP